MDPWILILFSTFLTIIVGLQAWMLLKITELDKQLYRLISDRESEKGTIARVHSDFEKRLRTLEQYGRTTR